MIKEKLYRIISKSGILIISKVFPEYFAKDPLGATDKYVEYPFAIKHLPTNKNVFILDVGCSGGYFPLIMDAVGYNVIGMDLRPYPSGFDLNFHQHDILDPLFHEEFFHAITCISTLEHIGIGGRYGVKEDLKADRTALIEMHRLLKPKGTLILTIPFGKYKVIKPFTKIYNNLTISRKIAGLFEIEKKEFYDTNYQRCNWMAVRDVDAKADPYPLCCLKLRKC